MQHEAIRKPLLATIAFLPTLALAEDEYVVYLKSAWEGIFSFSHSLIWVLGLFPLIVIIYAYSLAHKELATMRKGNSEGDKRAATGLYSVYLYLLYTITSLMIMFLIYGIFVMVFAHGDSIATGWEIFVFSFWKDMFSIS